MNSDEDVLIPSPAEALSSLLPQTTQVNGLGMWRSWTRVFESASNACLDLLDNCLDAALHETDGGSPRPFRGRVALEVLQLEDPEDPQGLGLSESNGITILNNSYYPIQSLMDALTVYKTSKHNDDAVANKAIGENGVGLKHGCATLSDTSFVLTKNMNVFSFGVIAKNLQTSQGIYLPSFELPEIDIDNSRNLYTTQGLVTGQKKQALRTRLEDIIERSPRVGEVLAKGLGSGNLDAGIDNLVLQFLRMWQDEWEQHDHVFQLVLCDLHHTLGSNGGEEGDTNANKTGKTDREDEEIGVARSDEDSNPARRFLHEIKALLPRFYINIPTERFDFLVDGSPIDFTYWQHRLVEFTKFTVHIPKSKPLQEMDDDNWNEMGYKLNIYCGFDPMRLKNSETGSESASCALFIYSRKRLIKQESDARHMLGLTTSGVSFMQGLTLLIDDTESQLPLMPTKDGIAWSEQKDGDVHRSNLSAWAGAVASAYWTAHFNNLGGRKKGAFGKEMMRVVLKSFTDPVLRLLGEEQEESTADTSTNQHPMKQMEKADLSYFAGLRWTKRVLKNTNKLSIRRHTSSVPHIVPGEATIFKFTEERIQVARDDMDEREDAKKNKNKRKKRKKPKQAESSEDELDKSSGNLEEEEERPRQRRKAATAATELLSRLVDDGSEIEEEELAETAAPDEPVSGGVAKPDEAVSGAAPVNEPSRKKRNIPVGAPIPEDLIITIADSSDEEEDIPDACTSNTRIASSARDVHRELQDALYELSQQKIALEQQKLEKIESQREVERLTDELNNVTQANARQDNNPQHTNDSKLQKKVKILKNERTYWQKEAEALKEQLEERDKTIRRLQGSATRSPRPSRISAASPNVTP